MMWERKVQYFHFIFVSFISIGRASKFGCKLPDTVGKISLTCNVLNSSYAISNSIYVKVKKTEVIPSCPMANDFSGNGRQPTHTCLSKKTNKLCIFKMFDVLVTAEGALITCISHKSIDFSHPSVIGRPPNEHKFVERPWCSYFPQTTALSILSLRHSKFQRYSSSNKYTSYNLVVPTRMKWDDCFNHISFQTVPFLGMIFEFHQDLWHRITWHTSLFTAALLQLLDVPPHRIVISKAIHAETILLPWIPSWCPPHMATFKGIAANVTRIMLKNLLDGRPENNIFSQKKNVSSSNITSVTVVSNSEVRYIVYLARHIKRPRPVVNQGQLLRILQKYLLPEYQIIILSPTPEYKSISGLHKSWREQAQIFSRARVVMGPHGGSFNNIIWTPNDCDFIEFNELPNNKSSNKVPLTPTRTVFLNAHLAKGGEGKFWILESIRKHPFDFYTSKILISPREMLEVFRRIGEMLVDNVNFEDYPYIKKSRWMSSHEAMEVYRLHGSLEGFPMSRSYSNYGTEYDLLE